MIPASANQWVSAIYRVEKNADGTFTYYGATGDFSLGIAGRSAIDVWKATLPAPRQFAPAATDPGTVLAVSGPAKAARNDTVTYTITYENRGTKPMANVVLFNAFADSFKYVSGSSGARPNGTRSPRCPIANDGSIPTPTSPASSRISLRCVSRSASSVVHCCPPSGRYGRGSVQIGQDSGSTSVAAN